MTINIPIFYEGNDDLIEILATSMCSICYNTKSFINFYILDCGICDFNKKQLESLKEKFNNFSIQYIPIDIGQFKDLRGYTEYNFVDCYSRLLIPELKPEMDRVIYLDSDVLAFSDVKNLWNESLDNYAIAGVLEHAYYNLKWVKNVKEAPKRGYINGGILIIDCKKWREDKIADKCFEIAKKYNKFIRTPIEDILSTYFQSNYKLLDFKYGYNDLPVEQGIDKKKPMKYITDGKKKKYFVHYTGSCKPWQRIKNEKGTKIEMFSNFWFFAQMTPFFAGLRNKFLSDNQDSKSNNITSTYKLFACIPVLETQTKTNNVTFKLFGIIPLLKINRK